jgi:hypothetical protein
MFTKKELRYVKWAIYSKLKEIENVQLTSNNVQELRCLSDDNDEYEILHEKIEELIDMNFKEGEQ